MAFLANLWLASSKCRPLMIVHTSSVSCPHTRFRLLMVAGMDSGHVAWLKQRKPAGSKAHSKSSRSRCVDQFRSQSRSSANGMARTRSYKTPGTIMTWLASKSASSNAVDSPKLSSILCLKVLRRLAKKLARETCGQCKCTNTMLRRMRQMLGCVYNGGVQNLDGSFVMVWAMRKQHLRRVSWLL